MAVQQIHDEVRHAGREAPDVGHSHDVGALHLRRELRLACEPRAEDLVREELGEHELDGDPLLELRVARLGDDAHPPLTEDARDLVAVGDLEAHEPREERLPSLDLGEALVGGGVGHLLHCERQLANSEHPLSGVPEQ